MTRQTFTTTICQLLGRKRIDSAEAADALFNEIRKAAEDKVTFGKKGDLLAFKEIQGFIY